MRPKGRSDKDLTNASIGPTIYWTDFTPIKPIFLYYKPPMADLSRPQTAPKAITAPDDAPNDPAAAAARADPCAPALPSVRGAPGVVAHLRKAILDGLYLYGDRLPAERQLARAFGCSRSTVREALRVLEQAGLIARRVGSGTFVAYRPGASAEDDVSEITSPVELIEVRLALEPRMVRLVAVNATARDLERLDEALARLEDSGADADHFTQWDRRFHQLLAEATHNPLMSALYRQINHVRGHGQWSAMKDKILSAERIADYNRQHRTLTRALHVRDGEAAQRIITRHLRDARRDLLIT